MGLAGYESRYRTSYRVDNSEELRWRAWRLRRGEVLLDEPFSNLVDLRDRLGQSVSDALKATGTAAILVTHHQDEAFALADRIGVMHGGAIAQWDTAISYTMSRSTVMSPILLAGRIVTGHDGGADRVSSPLGEIIGNRMYAIPEGAVVDLLVRPMISTRSRWPAGMYCGAPQPLSRKSFIR